jgi:hypothetical protein
MAKRRKGKTAFVPRAVLAAAFTGTSLVPFCVTSCGSDVTATADGAGGSDALFPVGDVAAPFDQNCCTVAAPFDQFAVADVGFRDASEAGNVTDARDEGDVLLGVADVGFGG